MYASEAILTEQEWTEAMKRTYNAAEAFEYTKESTTFFMADGSRTVLYRDTQTAVVHAGNQQYWLAKQQPEPEFDIWAQ